MLVCILLTYCHKKKKSNNAIINKSGFFFHQLFNIAAAMAMAICYICRFFQAMSW